MWQFHSMRVFPILRTTILQNTPEDLLYFKQNKKIINENDSYEEYLVK